MNAWMQCGCYIWFWFFGWTGQALAYALIGLSPPSILMAGRTHCLRRFNHARTVTIRKYHYLMHKVMASRSAEIDLQQGYLSLSSWKTKVIAYLLPGLSFRLVHQKYPVLLYEVVKDRFYEKIKVPLISHEIWRAFLNPNPQVFSILFLKSSILE